MVEFLRENGGTLVVCLAVLLIMALCAVYLLHKRRTGKGGCGCGCDHCPSGKLCHPRHK